MMHTLLLLSLLVASDKIGLVRDAIFHLPGLAPFAFGVATDTPLLGDWDGDGVTTPAVFRDGTFYFRNSNTAGFADSILNLGQPGDRPLVGDWNGDGRDDVGVWRYSLVILSTGEVFYYGDATDTPLAGDWDGDGRATIGVHRPGLFLLRNSNTSGFAEILIPAAGSGRAVAGDFNGDGRDEPRLIPLDGPVLAGHWLRLEPETPCDGIDVRSFRAPGDLDDYWMMTRAAAALKDGDTLVFPEGVYAIRRHIIDERNGTYRESLEGKVAALNDNRITFKNLKNVRIIACGKVIIDVKGFFIGGLDEDGLYRLQVVPFSFEHTENVTLEGFELRGNVQDMSRRLPGVYACVGYGIMSRANTGLKILDVESHHFSCDGFVTGYWTYKGDGVDRDITVERSHFHNNARQGMSVISSVGVRVLGSYFESNGYTDARLFGALSPASGVDIEPEDGSPETPPTSGVSFEDSIFFGNLGYDLRIFPYGSLPQPQIRDVTLIRSFAARLWAHPMVTLQVR
jgi:hypothetical protein